MQFRSISWLAIIANLFLQAWASSPIPLFRRQGNDDQVLAYFAAVGQCYLYLESVDSSVREKKQLGPCKTYCENEGETSYKCNSYDDISTFADVDDKDLIQYDDDGNLWIPSTCNCSENDNGSTPTSPPTSTGTTQPEPTSTGKLTCDVCRSTESKKLKRSPRFGVIWTRQSDEGDSCLLPIDQPSADSCEWSSNEARRDLQALEDRALDRKELEINLGRSIWVDFGQYPPCDDAKADSAVDKNFIMEDLGCSPVIDKVDKRGAAGLKLQTDHVYEAQNLIDFFKWLGGNPGAVVGNTILPTADWVQDVLLADDSGRFWPLEKPGRGPGELSTPQGGHTLDNVLTYGFGRVDGISKNGYGMTKALTVRNLALAQDSVNGKKGKWLGKDTPGHVISYNTNDRKVNMLNIKSGASAFLYLQYEPQGGDAIWNKWMRVSNWFDLVFSVFDSQYPWGGNAPYNQGEPTRNDGQTPSLRGLYAYWIDDHLTTIEGTAATWGVEAKAELEKWYKWTTASEIAWMDDAFGATGWVSQQMKFPRPTVAQAGASVFGAWGNEDMTFDAGGNKVTGLGLPLMP